MPAAAGAADLLACNDSESLEKKPHSG